ncbi:MAG: hypothetical protein EBX52_10220, partial [Proteobacteria bacterium]|nr:hypothetical protein [Pseudomonadota bacterium]
MDTEELKKGWIKWAVLEGLLTGGYYGAETNLPPLLSAFIPAPYQNLGWTGLHALLQLAVFFKVFSPLVRARVEQLYPGIEERSAKLVVFLSVFPMTLFPLLLFFAISKGDEDPAKAPFFIRRPGATMAGFVATLISLVFLGASLETPPIGFEGLQEITYWTLDPTAQYITKLGSDVGKAAAIK